jgi:hypothetical protein
MSTATIPSSTRTNLSLSTLSRNESEILALLRSLRFGQITVQVHDARIVQIERTEKIRPEHQPS